MASNVSSLSMVGKAYGLCGKGYYRCRGPESLTKDFKPDETTQYIALGTSGSWYRSFKRKDSSKNVEQVISRSANFPTQYPSLDSSLTSLSLFQPPKCLSLGPKGHYFASIATKKLWRLPKTIEERLGNLADYEAVFLGQGDAYVAVRKGGGVSMDLMGKYAGLAEAVKANGAPKVLAMNLEDGHEWVAVWEEGNKYSRRSGRTCLPSAEADLFFERMGFKTGGK